MCGESGAGKARRQLLSVSLMPQEALARQKAACLAPPRNSAAGFPALKLYSVGTRGVCLTIRPGAVHPKNFPEMGVAREGQKTITEAGTS